MKLYLKALKLHLKAALEYKASFILSLLSQVLVFFSYYFVILALFDKFGNLQGFTLYEVLLCFAIIHFGFSMNELFARGIDHFDRLIISGKFDILLLRPKNIILQVLISEIDYVKASRVFQSLIVLVIALLNLKIDYSPIKILTLFLMMISAILIFFSLFVLAASYCFVTIQGLEITHVFCDGGKYVAQYPIGIFKKGMIFVFTFIIPYAFINYYPLLYFLGKSDNILYAFSPLLIVLYLIPCIMLFNRGIRKYTSVGC